MEKAWQLWPNMHRMAGALKLPAGDSASGLSLKVGWQGQHMLRVFSCLSRGQLGVVAGRLEDDCRQRKT
jgi:hypothetical protein